MAKIRTRTGTELSDKDVEALAVEAEKGYDLKRARRTRVGRPALGAGGTSPRVQVRVDPKLAKALRAHAHKEKRSVSEVARTALREYVENSHQARA